MSDPTCTSRYLTADGRVLACEQEHPFRDTHFFRPNPGTAIETAPDSDDPCVFDATCGECGGTALGVDDDRSDLAQGITVAHPCPTCDGTGVDERIPLRLVGVGSEATHPDYAEFQCFIVSIDVNAHPTLAVIEARGRLRASFPVRWAEGWTVVRAVPPAHTEDD